ncbi:hypothetical protein Tsubulata_004665 [Turnera subulata]|uniref:Uncharacterized protein n=1 Tax=Turnera subulata TaxID=218843 RepID=A0A9Q0GCN4_9ROSI|nr:hypothetical protein Tsubulata_004665 [Turnera subulata]
MPEKGMNFAPSTALPWFLRSNPLLPWRFHILTALVFFGMVVIWSLDGCTIKSFIESWSLRQQYSSIEANSLQEQTFTNLTHEPIPKPKTHQNPNSSMNFIYLPQAKDSNFTSQSLAKDHNFTATSPLSYGVVMNTDRGDRNGSKSEKVSGRNYSDAWPEKPGPHEAGGGVQWLTAELEANFTANLLAGWVPRGKETCTDGNTVEIAIPGLDGQDSIELTAGDIHEFVFQALDASKNPLCLGGDYFETDLSGEAWRSRPLVKDFANGSYSLSLQVHPDFIGDYDLTIVLLYRKFQGLRFSPYRFILDKQLRKIRIKFVKGRTQLPQVQMCQKSDFARDIWTGRWTRHARNDSCSIDDDGRYRCQPLDYPCQSPWCDGALGVLESNGWVYSSHCSFRLFDTDAAWNCLKNRWIFFWGDSNHVDTIRNMLNFVLDLPEIPKVPRRFDMNFTNHRDASQSVRITSIFNGHWNETGNYQGLNSLQDEGFRELLKQYFSEDTVPDTIIMNSGLHDGVFWKSVKRFALGAEFAASFWKEVMDSVRQRGLEVPRIFYRTTVATGGYARALQFNPNKMEVFNWVVLDKFRQAGLISGVIDNFDMTFPWHFDNRCNDGVHYGRAPAKLKWRDGQIGHQYFVDLMLAHVLLNALCAR